VVLFKGFVCFSGQTTFTSLNRINRTAFVIGTVLFLRDGNNVYTSFNILRVKNAAKTANIANVCLSSATEEWCEPIDPFFLIGVHGE